MFFLLYGLKSHGYLGRRVDLKGYSRYAVNGDPRPYGPNGLWGPSLCLQYYSHRAEKLRTIASGGKRNSPDQLTATAVPLTTYLLMYLRRLHRPMPDGAHPGLHSKPLDAAIGQEVLAPYRPGGGRHGPRIR